MNVFERAIEDLELRERLIQWIVQAQRLGCAPDGRYLSRTEAARFCARRNAQGGTEAFWLMLKSNREYERGPLPLADVAGVPFWLPRMTIFTLASHVERATGAPEMLDRRYESAVPAWMRESILREEAIATCILDGIAVDRDGAREMFESGRAPRSREERAVWQAHWVLNRVISSELYDPPTPEWLLGWHQVLTESTSDIVDSPGRLRRAAEVPSFSVPVPHDLTAPAAKELPSRIEALCRFLGRSMNDGFVDCERATVAHLWMAHDRPFAEANGRMARVLHYAVLGDQYGRWPKAAGMVSLSARLVRLRGAYARWLHDVRENENDAGFFVYPQLQVLNTGVDRFLRNVRAIRNASHAAEASFPGIVLNERQVEALARAMKDPTRWLTVEQHRRRHGVVYETARTDLRGLKDLDLFEQSKRGRAYVFRPVPSLAERLSAVPPEIE